MRNDTPMDAHAVASRYRNETIESAPPLKIVRMMYQGAMRFLDQAADRHATDSGAFRANLDRAEAVVTELRIALDRGKAPELAGQLETLYLFVESEIQGARAGASLERLANARQVLETLYSAWREIDVRP